MWTFNEQMVSLIVDVPDRLVHVLTRYSNVFTLVISGRIHSAVISNIDYANRSVTVEWSESEEIKGKEVSFALMTD